jgi:hypothetical protein
MKRNQSSVVRKSPDNDQAEFLREGTVAEMLDVGTRTLADWRYRRIGPPYLRFNGTTVRYRRADVLAWAATQGST